MTLAFTHPDFVHWFRDSTPYIHSHRGKTFVVSFGGALVETASFPHLIHDFALLEGLGVRLVLVHGIRHQVESRLKARGLALRYHQGLRITDAEALECVKEAAGTVRVEIEALLSMGLANSPMAGVRIQVVSGNFVTARPVGIRDGIDFENTGEVRRIDAEGIRRVLDLGAMVLLSAIGYSPTGDIFNLRSEDVATAAAIALGADKLIMLGQQPSLPARDAHLLRQLTTAEAEALLHDGRISRPDLVRQLTAAVQATRAGVERVHLLDDRTEGALLLELFTRDGIGYLVSQSPFETLRPATGQDVSGMLDIIRPLVDQGILVARPRERLQNEIDDYVVLEREGFIIGCAALHVYPTAQAGELACLALHRDYQGDGRGERLLSYIEERAGSLGLTRLFALSTRTVHWFRERGYQPATLEELPPGRRASYDPARNSRILVRSIG
jgi:amino-acid N-acetyltransferase